MANKIEIDLNKLLSFMGRHKEAIVVGVIAGVIINKQTKQIDVFQSFISSRGLVDEYCDYIC